MITIIFGALESRVSSRPPPDSGRSADDGALPAHAPSDDLLQQPRPPRFGRLVKWLKRIGIATLLLVVLAGVGVVLVIRHYEADLPSTADLKNYQPPQVTRIVARDGTVLGELFTERRTVVRIDAIPSQVKLAVLAAEDAGFYEHAGLNYLGMLRALAINLRSVRARQGASTITQQVVKNVLLTHDRTFARKAREIILARKIEQELTKDEILELYLNKIYFGHGRYGVEEASRYYFGKRVRDVTLAEAAMLAAVVKGPSVYSPKINLERATARRAFVLDQMQHKGFATEAQVTQAKNEPIALAIETDAVTELAPEVVTEVQRTLRQLLGPDAERGGYTVMTSIDPGLQQTARNAVRQNLDAYAKRHKLLGPITKAKKKEPASFEGTPSGHKIFQGVVTDVDDDKGTLSVRVGTLQGSVLLRQANRYNPKGLLPSKFIEKGKVVRVRLLAATPDPVHDQPADDSAEEQVAEEPAKPVATSPVPLKLELGPEGALVAIDVRTREIVALVGSYDAVRGGLDRATFAHRQPGSTFKSFVYGYGIQSRAMTAASILETNPEVLGDYKPQNYDESEGQSPKRLREALAHSVNVAAVWTLSKLGPANVVAFSQALGIQSKLGADLSLALGSYEVTPREMAAAYASIAGGGVYEQPILITKIVGPGGTEIALPPRPPSHHVMNEAEAYVLTSLLTSVVQTGTGKTARSLGRPIAGKTGTSNHSKDAWFVGFSADIACAVWTGYDDSVSLGYGETGAISALPAFIGFMKEAHSKRPVADFPVPPGVVRVRIDPASGLLAFPDQEDAIDEVFLEGTEPKEEALPDGGADAGDDASVVEESKVLAVEPLDAGVIEHDPEDNPSSVVQLPKPKEEPSVPLETSPEAPPF